MLVFIDAEGGTVTLYGKSVMTVPFSKVVTIRALLAGKQVQYISEVVETSGDELLDMISDLAEFVTDSPREVKYSDGMTWLYATGSGYMNIPAAKMIFAGPTDFKLLNQLGDDLFIKNPILQDLLNKGKLAVVDTNEKNKILMKVARRQAEQDERGIRNSNGDAMIVDTSGGRIKGRQDGLGDEFEEITGNDPAEDFQNESQKMLAQFADLGKEADERAKEEAEEAEAE